MIISKKGPLFVLEKEGEKTRFASVPSTLSLQTATRADAEAAFSAATTASAIDILGELDGDPVQRKKGPYGFYVKWDTMNIPCKVDDTQETIIEKIKQKQTQSQPKVDAEGNALPAEAPYERKVGDYTIKRGPYGLYFFKHTLKKVTFASFPQASDPDKVTPTDMPQLFQLAMNAKKHASGFKKKQPADTA